MVAVLRQKKTYTRFSALLVLLATIFAWIALVAPGWIKVGTASVLEERFTLEAYGPFKACLNVMWEPSNASATSSDCFDIGTKTCEVLIYRPQVVGAYYLPFPPIHEKCTRWQTSIGIFISSLVFFSIGSVLTFFSAFAASPSLSTGAATANGVGTLGVFLLWVVIAASVNFEIPGAEGISVPTTFGYPMVLMLFSWIFGLAATGMEIAVALPWRRASYTLAYSDDDNGVGATDAAHND